MALELEVKGLEELIRKLSKGSEVAKAIDEAVRDGADKVFTDSQHRVPVDTGTLKKSGSVKKVDEGEYSVGYSADYAAYVEYGTSRQRAQPYLEPALENNRSFIERRVREKVKEAIEA